MADGSIRIDTKIDTKKAEIDLKKLADAISGAEKGISDAGKKIDIVFSGRSAKQLEASIAKANDELRKTLELKKSIEAQGEAVQSSYQPQYAAAKSEEMRMRIDDMAAYELAPINSRWTEAERKAEAIRQSIAAMQSELKGVRAAEESAASAAAYAKQAKEEQVKAAKKAKKAAKEQAKAEKESAKEAKRASAAITGGLNRGLKAAGRLALSVLGIQGAFSLVRRAVSRYVDTNEKLKNQLDAIWNVLGTAIGPAVEKLVSWLSAGITYANALIKALTGVDLIAKSNAAAMSKQADAAKKTADASKSLAGFDEMNKLQDTSSSGSADQASGIFAPASVDLSGVEKVAGTIKKLLPLIKAVGTALLSWKILTQLPISLKAASGYAAAIAGAVSAISGFIDAWKNGLDWENLGEMIGGIAAAAAGLALACGSTAAAITLIAGGIGLVVSGFKSWIDDGKSAEALIAISVGLLAIGGAIALLTGSWIPLLIAAIAAIVAGIVMYWDEIKAAFAAAWEWIVENIWDPLCEFFAPLIDGAKEAWDWINEHLLTPIGEFLGKLWDDTVWFFSLIGSKIWEIVSGVGRALWAIIKKVWEIFKKIGEIFAALGKAFYDYVLKPVIDWLSGAWDWVYDHVIKPIIDFFKDVGSWVYNHIIKPVIDKVTKLKDDITELFKKITEDVVNFVSNQLKAVVNGLLTAIETTINGFLKMLNGAIDIINKIPGVDITKIELLHIPRLARGGIVNNPGKGVPIIAGEAGKEAVLPLDRNTEWMDLLAERLGAAGGKSIVVQVILSGKKIHEEIIRLDKQRFFATNGAV